MTATVPSAATSTVPLKEWVVDGVAVTSAAEVVGEDRVDGTGRMIDGDSRDVIARPDGLVERCRIRDVRVREQGGLEWRDSYRRAPGLSAVLRPQGGPEG